MAASAQVFACTGEQSLGDRGDSGDGDAAVSKDDASPVVDNDAGKDSASASDSGDTKLPTVTLTVTPTTVTTPGMIRIAVAASATSAITKIVIYEGGTTFDTWVSPPYAASVNIGSGDNGLYTFTASATDSAGRVGTSSPVTVTVNIPAVDGGADANSGDASTDSGTPLIAAPGTKRAFVTEGVYTGDLKLAGGGSSGPDGADKLCAQEAQTASLGGTWKAWIRDVSSGSGALRIGARGPWARLGDRAFVFQGTSATGNPLVPINRTSLGNVISSTQNYHVFTSVNNDGTMMNPDLDCQNWTSSSSGYDGAYGNCTTTYNWSSTGTSWCNHAAHLYCFEQ